MEKNKHLSIAYVGDDFHYYIQLKKRFAQEFALIDFQFVQIKIPTDITEEIGPVLHQLSTLIVDIVYIDYSVRSLEYLKLGKLFKNQVNKRNIPVIGLVGQNNKGRDFQQALIRGIKIIHVKGLDFSILMNQSLYLTQKVSLPNIQLSKATNVGDEFVAINVGRIGYVHPYNLHIESDMNFKETPTGTVIHVKTTLPQECDHSEFTITSSSRENIYYNLNYGYNLSYHFEDPEVLKVKRDTIKTWIEKYGTDTFPKKTRVMIIDKHLEILTQTKKSIDSYPYSFRFHQVIDVDNNFSVISEVAPAILCYVMDGGSREDEEMVIMKLSLFLQNNKHFRPYIVVFENNTSAPPGVDYKTKIKYPDILYHNDSFNFELLMKLIAMYEKKKGVVWEEFWKKILPQEASEDPRPFFFDKTDLRSIIYHEHSIKLDQISEMQLSFYSPLKIDLYTAFHLKGNGKLDMNVTVINATRDMGMYKYVGFINGLNEIGFNKLRVYINEILARPKRKKEEMEKQRFFELNKKYANKKESE